ncbi:hypothetical protein [Umezawaea beigongshangensis]|uniref:hypothetical protein n=1 Tax=Umezawaea beigongshangensis TaxID=2780383 RepID=UPI0018F1A7E3|nr:hypothetical protein [Umezawaea beigongshangensis]
MSTTVKLPAPDDVAEQPATGIAAPPPTALDLLTEHVERVRATDVTDTATALLVAWRAFGAAGICGTVLTGTDPGSARTADRAQRIHVDTTWYLAPAPSLPCTDAVIVPVNALVPDQTDDPAGRHGEVAPSDVDQVRLGIVALAEEITTMLSGAAEAAVDTADRCACESGARAALDLARCWYADGTAPGAPLTP